MITRKIVEIDEEKCNGCGLCIPNCAEGALQIVNGKAKLASDIYCDGLGACLGNCPLDAIKIVERKAEVFDETAVQERISKLKEKKEEKKKPIACNCPSAMMKEFPQKLNTDSSNNVSQISNLTQWPIQLNLVPSEAHFLKECDLLIAADCVPFAYPNFHQELLAGKKLLIGCPKLDDMDFYIEHLTQIIKTQELKSLSVVIMEVPCCGGIKYIVEKAIKNSGIDIKLNTIIISIQGERK